MKCVAMTQTHYDIIQETGMKSIFYIFILVLIIFHPLTANAESAAPPVAVQQEPDPMTVVKVSNLKPEKIRDIKFALQARGPFSGIIDGHWHNKDAKALGLFQRQNGERGRYNGSMITLRTLKILGVDVDPKTDLVKQDE
jgi:hypothetical protein